MPAMRLPTGQVAILREGSSGKVAQRSVDLCIVFDTTGSMSDKIDGLVGCMSSLVADLGRLALDWRVVTLPFGDLTVPGDRVVDSQPFVSTVQDATRQLRSMPLFSGGMNAGESSVEAMLAACKKRYRPAAVKVLLLVTDEPALGAMQGARAVDQALTRLDAACFTVAPSLGYYKDWARRHGGEWRQVAAAVDTGAILQLFKSLLARIAVVADSVHKLGGGSVRAYLERGGGA
jgi:hypothetical protein